MVGAIGTRVSGNFIIIGCIVAIEPAVVVVGHQIMKWLKCQCFLQLWKQEKLSNGTSQKVTTLNLVTFYVKLKLIKLQLALKCWMKDI